MTENQDTEAKYRANAKKIYDATKAVVGKVADKTLEGAGEFLNNPLDTTDKIYQGLKNAGKKALNFGVDTATNLLTDPQKALHTGLGLLERGLGAIPVVGGAFSFLTGTAKDALTDQKFENLAKEIQGVKEGLNTLADAVGDALDGLRGEMAEALEAMGARQDQLEQFTKAFQAEQNKINKKVQQQISKIEETLKEHEKKIQNNTEKIFKEQIKLQDVRNELKDQIKVTNTNLNNLRKEQEETKHDFEKYKHQINEKTAKTEQSFDDLQADYTRRNKIIETQIHDNEENLSDLQENLSNVHYQQKKLSLEHQEFAENLEEQINLSYEQKKRLDLVVNEIEDIHEEFNAKISRIQKEQLEQEEKVDEAVFAAKRATRKVDEIADKLEKHNKKVDKLQEQIEKNKQDTQKAKEEAKLANERLDNLLKSQKLLDNSKETQTLDNIQKTFQLKAEEAQLLASLELLKKTQKLITTPAEREWKVGIKEGTETQIPRPEGMPLNPNSSWAKKYTPEQLQKWGWDTRLFSENETAPLTDPEKRKPEEANPSQSQQQTEQSQEQQKNLQEVIEETKSQLLEQLQEIQEQINETITPLEEKTTAPEEDSESEEEEEITELEQKEQQLLTQKSQAKTKLTKSRNKQQSLQQQKAQTQSEIIKEQKQIQKIEQILGNPSTTPQQKQKLQENKIEREEKLTQLQKQLEQVKEVEKEEKNKEQQADQEVQQINKQLDKIQQQKPSITAEKLEKEIKDQEKQVQQSQQEILEKQWEQVKKTEEQILEDIPEPPTLQKIEEKIQEIKESQSSTAAPQKSMSLYMLYLIIFLLEYVVYKRNGLPGLVVLNIVLLICYWYKEQITEHYAKNYKQFGHYLLIIGYIVGNVLAYSAPEQEKYKVPCVVGYNAILAALYSYSWYKNRKVIETKQEELVQVQEEYQEEFIKNEGEYIVRLQEASETLEKIKEKTKTSSVINFTSFAPLESNPQFFQTGDETKIKSLYEKIKKQWARKEDKPYLESHSAEQLAKLLHQAQGQQLELTDEEQEFLNNLQNKQIQEESQQVSKLITKIPTVPEEEKKTLTKLLNSLSKEQSTAIANKSLYLQHWESQTKLEQVYPHLTQEQKLKLFNSGLDNLQIKTFEQKQQLLNILNSLSQESRQFDLSTPEKENILRLITSKVSGEQLETYEQYGVPLYNATNWKITPEHKKSLLNLADDLITLNNEQKETLNNADSTRLDQFSLAPNQENILKTLSPLKREYKYSSNQLAKIRSLKLGNSATNYLVQQEIIPNPNTDFGESKDPYQELKQTILTKNQRQIRQSLVQITKEQKKEEIAIIRNSLLPALLDFAGEELDNLNLYEYRLAKETFQEKNDWVSMKAINSQQRDLLLTNGFKLSPCYYFFDLLFFTVENFAINDWKGSSSNNINWEKWSNISLEFTEELVQEWINNGFYYETVKEWIDIGMNPAKDAGYCAWLRNNQKMTPEQVLNYENGTELWNQYQEFEAQRLKNIEEYKTQILTIIDAWKDNSNGSEKEALKGIIKVLANESLSSEQQFNELQTFFSKFPSANVKLNNLVMAWSQKVNKVISKQEHPTSTFANFLAEHSYLKPKWEEYLELVVEREKQELQRKAKRLTSLSSSGKSGSISVAPNISYLEEKFERLTDAYEKMRNYIEEREISFDNQGRNSQPEQQQTNNSSSNSKYDNLFNELDKEERERLQKKKTREEAKKKLDEAEFKRRQGNLSEKDRKVIEDAEKRQKEKELEEQEAEAAQKRQEEREKNIAEDRQELLDNEAKRLEAEKKRAEKELQFKEEEMKAEKEKKEQEIEELRKKNEQEERELTQKRELMEQELAKELEAINIADKEGRRQIEEKFRMRQNEIKKEMDALKRKNDDELKEKEATAIKERQENEIKLSKMREEVRIQNEQAQQAKEAADQQERLLKDERNKRNALDKLRKELYDAVMEYRFTEDEGRKGTKNPQQGYGDLRTFLDLYPSMEFNLDFGDTSDLNITNSTYRKAIQIFRKVVGNRFVTKGELKNLIEKEVRSLDLLN